jgi:hypothetical protein
MKTCGKIQEDEAEADEEVESEIEVNVEELIRPIQNVRKCDP